MSTATKVKAERDAFCSLLQQIAHGREYQRRGVTKPIAGTEAQQIARSVLARHGIHWSPSMTEKAK